MTTLNRTSAHINAFGTMDITSAKSVEEALTMANLDWEVEKRPIFDANGKQIDKWMTTNRSDNGDVLGMVGKNYVPVQNAEAFNFVNDLPDEGDFKFESVGTFKNGNGIWLMGQLPKENILGDDVTNNIVFINSHDGSSGVKVLMTPTRVICSNMLNLAMKQAQRQWSARHTKKIDIRMKEAQKTLGLAGEYMRALSEEAERLADAKVDVATLESIFDAMFPVKPDATERQIRNISTLKDNYFRCLNEDDIKKFVGTKWAAINAMADLVDHSEPMRLTKNYYNNAWMKQVNGHPVLDNFYSRLQA